MAIYLGGRTTLDIWRHASLGLCAMPISCTCTSLVDSAASSRELVAAVQSLLLAGAIPDEGRCHRDLEPRTQLPGVVQRCARPFELLVDHKNKSHRMRGAKVRICRSTLPSGSLFRIPNTDVRLASPELIFLQLGNGRALLPKIELGMELCGSYVRGDLAPQGQTELEQGERGRVPRLDAGCEGRPSLTNVARLHEFLNESKGMHGIVASRRALRWVLDGARSPRGSALHLALDLPSKLGGYGMGTPLLNHPLDLGAGMRAGSCIADLAYPKERVVVEYDGFAPHGGRRLESGEVVFDADKVLDDKDRWSRIQAAGWKLVVFCGRDTTSFPRFDTKARQLASCLGKDAWDDGPETTRARDRLRKWLFDPRRQQL